MRITIVMGFFLPMPPTAGGATEKCWEGLAREFATRGHTVTVLSRDWPGRPHEEVVAGVQHRRLRGYDHTGKLVRNLWLDLLWSWRVWRHLPAADVTVVHCVALPVWLGWFRRRSGRLVVMPGRMPKGQYRFYRRLDRVLAGSSSLRSAVLAENPRLESAARIFGCPIDWPMLAAPRPLAPGGTVTIGYIGRLHREKGLDLLLQAVQALAARSDLPPWRLLLCGPADIARGGSGEAYVAGLTAALAAVLPPERYVIHPPVFEAAALAALYRGIDVFCYPSLAQQGETFGVAVAEAMAAGAVPVVSRLACFTDFVHRNLNGEDFDHHAPDAPARLADVLAGLLCDPARRQDLARAAQTGIRRYDFPVFADRLLADFSALK